MCTCIDYPSIITPHCKPRNETTIRSPLTFIPSHNHILVVGDEVCKSSLYKISVSRTTMGLEWITLARKRKAATSKTIQNSNSKLAVFYWLQCKTLMLCDACHIYFYYNLAMRNLNVGNQSKLNPVLPPTKIQRFVWPFEEHMTHKLF